MAATTPLPLGFRRMLLHEVIEHLLDIVQIRLMGRLMYPSDGGLKLSLAVKGDV
jgi:hypothetical protein